MKTMLQAAAYVVLGLLVLVVNHLWLGDITGVQDAGIFILGGSAGHIAGRNAPP